MDSLLFLKQEGLALELVSSTHTANLRLGFLLGVKRAHKEPDGFGGCVFSLSLDEVKRHMDRRK